MRRNALLASVYLLALLVLAGGWWYARDRAPESAPPAVHGDPVAEDTAEGAGEEQEAVDAGIEEPPGVIVVRGVVLGDDEEPLTGATVSLLRYDGSALWLGYYDWMVAYDRPLKTAITGDGGEFEFPTPVGTPLVVAANKPGLVPAAAAISGVESEPVRLTLRAGSAFEFVIVDERGDPVAGARLARSSWGGPHVVREVTTTGPDGRARLFHAHNACVYVSAPGRVTIIHDFRDEPETDAPTRLVLRRATSVRGVVVDGEGRPIAAALVKLGGVHPEQAQRTAADGTFAIDGVAPEAGARTYLETRCEGWAADPESVFPGDEAVRIVMRRPGSIRGVVVHADGAPASRAKIYFGGDAPVWNASEFEITGLAPGAVELMAGAPAPGDAEVLYTGRAAVSVVEGQCVPDVRIVVGPNPRHSYVRVAVEDERGAPVAGADVAVWCDGDELEDGRAGKDGIVLLEVEDRPGTNVVVGAATRDAHGVLDARTVSTVRTGSEVPLDTVVLRLGTPGRLRLRLVDARGQEVPFKPEYVEVGSSHIRFTRGGYDLPAVDQFWGTFDVPGLATRFLVFDPPHARQREETIRLLPATEVSGRLLGPDGAPASSETIVALHVETQDEDGNPSYVVSDSTTVDDEGRFTLGSVPPGRAVMRVLSGEPKLLHTTDFRVEAGTPVDVGEVRLRERIRISGRVVDRDGRGLGGARIDARDGGGRSDSVAHSGLGGAFELEVPKAASMQFLVTRRGRATRVVDRPESDGQPLQVVLETGGSVSVERASDGRLPEHWSVRARLPGRRVAWAPSWNEGESGEFVLHDLPAGPLEILIDAGRRTLVRTVAVVAGETVDCVLDE